MENNEIMNENEFYEGTEMNGEGLVVAEEESRKIGLLDVAIVGSVAYTGYKVVKAGVKGVKKLCGKIFRKKKKKDDEVIEDVEYVEVDQDEIDDVE